MEQGLGVGSGAPFFNRMEAQATRFLQLTKPRGKGAPVTFVAHAKLGNTLGDLPAYDAFLLGGPFSGGLRGLGAFWASLAPPLLARCMVCLHAGLCQGLGASRARGDCRCVRARCLVPHP